jgi:hypothetical protein
MKLRSLVIRTILAWVPILPPPPLLARPQGEASPPVFLRGPALVVDSPHAWTEPEESVHRRRVSRPSLNIAFAWSRGV